jgi:DHA2 family methylenomycin A resistance protein-like MFS transporter
MFSMAFVAICAGYFTVILDTTAVNTALPSLRADLGASVADLQWVVDGYTLAFAALLLSGGALGDRLGARRVFAIGLAGFVTTSAVCGLAPSVATLVGARVLQGVAAAILVPASLALVQASSDSSAGRARAVGAWGAVAGIAAASGPVIGGALSSAVSWRVVFFVNVPIGLAALAMVHGARDAPRHPARRLDLAGQLLAVVALAALTVALIEDLPEALAVAALAAAAFVAVERRVAEPVLPLGLLRAPGFAGGTLIGLLMNLGFYGQLFVVNLLFQEQRGLSALHAGLAILPEGICVSLGSLLSGRLTARAGGPRPTLVLGLGLAAAGLVGLAVLGADAPYAALVAPLAATGLGMSLTMPAATTAVVEAAPGGRAGLAAGVINASRQVGGVIGVALLGGLTGPAFALAAGAFALALVLTATVHASARAEACAD